MPTNSASSLKKTNQELKAHINILFCEIENLKLQLGVNADDDSTAAAEQTVKDHQSPTNEHSDSQSGQTRSCRGKAQAVKSSSFLSRYLHPER